MGLICEFVCYKVSADLFKLDEILRILKEIMLVFQPLYMTNLHGDYSVPQSYVTMKMHAKF